MPAVHRYSAAMRFAPLAALVLLLALAAPAAASPGGIGGAPAAPADHVTDCNVEFDAEGNLLVDAERLTGAEAAVLDAVLAGDASLAAALDLAADADADACVNLAIDVEAASVTLNADITACGAVVIEGEAVSVGGAEIDGALLTAEVRNLLEAAAAAGVNACVAVTVTDNDVVVDVVAELCAIATLLDDGMVSISIDDEEFLVDAVIVDADGLLEVGASVEVGLVLVATIDVASEGVDVTLVVTDCGGPPEPAPTPTPEPAPTDAGGPGVGSGATPAPLLPDTAAGPATGAGFLPVLFLVLTIVSATVGAVTLHRRR